MASETTDLAIPLFQATLVAISVWLGVARYFLREFDDLSAEGAGLVTAGTVFLWGALLSFSSAIINQSGSEAIRQGVIAINGLMILITAALVGMFTENTTGSGKRFYAKQLVVALLAVICIIVIEAVMRGYYSP